MNGFSANAAYRPCRNVAGDLYEVVAADEQHIVFYVADAAGHGVSAAMLAVLFKHRIAALDENGRPRRPAQRMLDAHRALASLDKHNRDEFLQLIESLQGEVSQMEKQEANIAITTATA